MPPPGHTRRRISSECVVPPAGEQHTAGAAQDAHDIEVVAPQLQIAVNGPSRRYLDRPATYTVELANPGTASATNVELVTYLPKGMKYVTRTITMARPTTRRNTG